jgi:hypothetical protein
MSRFQLVFRRDGHKDQTKHRFDDADGEPQIDERSIDGGTFVIGTLVVEPNDA